jgi:hypothetical protein
MEFKAKKVYSFSTLAPSQLGDVHTNMKVIIGEMTADAAVMYRNVRTLHNNLKSVIPGLPSSADDCTYILFEKQDTTKEKIVLAYEYIDIYTISEVQSVSAVYTFPEITTDKIAIISTRLRELGIYNFQVTTNSE